MSHTSLVDALGLLLSDPHLRQQFAVDALAVAKQLNISNDARAIF